MNYKDDEYQNRHSESKSLRYEREMARIKSSITGLIYTEQQDVTQIITVESQSGPVLLPTHRSMQIHRRFQPDKLKSKMYDLLSDYAILAAPHALIYAGRYGDHVSEPVWALNQFTDFWESSDDNLKITARLCDSFDEGGIDYVYAIYRLAHIGAHVLDALRDIGVDVDEIEPNKQYTLLEYADRNTSFAMCASTPAFRRPISLLLDRDPYIRDAKLQISVRPDRVYKGSMMQMVSYSARSLYGGDYSRNFLNHLN